MRPWPLEGRGRPASLRGHGQRPKDAGQPRTPVPSAVKRGAGSYLTKCRGLDNEVRRSLSLCSCLCKYQYLKKKTKKPLLCFASCEEDKRFLVCLVHSFVGFAFPVSTVNGAFVKYSKRGRARGSNQNVGTARAATQRPGKGGKNQGEKERLSGNLDPKTQHLSPNYCHCGEMTGQPF